MAQTVILAGPMQRGLAKRLIDEAPKGFSVTIEDVKAQRTIQQNRTLHMWFGEIAKHSGDLDAVEVKGMCHRRWGLAIKMRDRKWAWVWENSGARLAYEKQCKLLASGVLNVSSSMTVDELKEYLDAMALHFRAEGVPLTDPEARKYEAMA